MLNLPSVRELAETRLSGLLIAVFVDSAWLHKWWGCHRISGRSFFVGGRQFHVCARCTGILLGIPVSFLLLPWRADLPVVGAVFLLALLLDGVTQMIGWRESNNVLRFVTGAGASMTFLPSLLALGQP